MSQHMQAPTERIDIRTTHSALRRLQEAAATQGKTVAQFVLDAALAEAASLPGAQPPWTGMEWIGLMATMDEPPKCRPPLQALLREPGVFD